MASSPETPLPGDGSVSPPADSSTPPSPPQPESSPPPPDASSPPPADLTPPPPADSTPPPPADSATQPPPSPTVPESQPPPTQSPPTSNPAIPAVPDSPQVVSPPADGGLAQTPPSPDLPQSPPKKHHGSPHSSPKEGSSSSDSSSDSSSSSSSSSSSDNKELPVILGIIFGGLLVLILMFLLLKWWNKKKRQRFYMEQGIPPKGDPYYKQKLAVDPNAKFSPSPGMGGYIVPSGEFSSGQYGGPLSNQSPNKMMGSYGAKSEFSYEVLAAATGGFSPANVIGQGGFGFVHKGVLPDGTVVAVKSLKAGSGQGEREFQAEVEIISRVHHRYLVSLVGYCIAGGQRMLVYEFVSNKTLEYHLHGKDQPVMDWAVRRRIAVGSAKGLAYLHEDCHPRIIHRDIKAANILLDDNFEAKVADFGLAKLSTDNYTHVSTRVMGTFGYLAPEYAASGKLTEKSDVFSFGVMLLELITGRRPIDPTNVMEDSLVDWARPLMTKGMETGDYSELVDPRLGDNYNPTEMARMIACAAASIRHSARKRPRMSQIVRILDGNSSLDDLNLNTNDGVKVGESAAFNPYDTRAYNADIMKFRQMVLSGTEDFSSGNTNEFGLNQSPGSSGADSREMGLTGPIQKPNEQ